MKIEVKDAESLPAWMQAHVSEGHLDLTAIPEPEDVQGLKSALEKERKNAGQWAKFGSPDDVQSKIAELEEKAKGTGKGAEDAQAKLDAMKTDYEAKLAEKDNTLKGVFQRGAMSDLKAELAKAGFLPEAIEDIATGAMARIGFNDDGTPKVLTVDGSPQVGSGKDHGATLSDLAKELAASRPYALVDAGKGGGGKQPGNGGTPSKTVTRSQWDSMSHRERADFSKSGGKVTD